jgi:predicted ArsR family transcriptional regulator
VARRQHRVILVALESMTDGTAEEIAQACGLQTHEVGKRLKELSVAGRIAETGETRRQTSGRMARVWRLA